jgi:hypothetical protein
MEIPEPNASCLIYVNELNEKCKEVNLFEGVTNKYQLLQKVFDLVILLFEINPMFQRNEILEILCFYLTMKFSHLTGVSQCAEHTLVEARQLEIDTFEQMLPVILFTSVNTQLLDLARKKTRRCFRFIRCGWLA